jgi:hypothetical protein
MTRLLLFAIFLLVGCMKPESTVGSDPEPKSSGVVDETQRAGATSSTNWPTEDAPAPRPKIKAVLDSTLTFQFLDTALNGIKRSGTLVLYRSGVIPALDRPDSVVVHFEEQLSIKVSPINTLPFKPQDSDTIRFSVRVATDSLECLLLGFSYAIHDKKFLNSPFSSIPNSSYPMTSRHFSYHGKADSSLAKLGISDWGKDEWCFYIPGSPFFWKAEVGPDLEIGPLPFGDFPVRLLRISKTGAGSDVNHLETYEVKIRPKLPDGPNQGATVHSFSLGAPLLSMDVNPSISIRSR